MKRIYAIGVFFLFGMLFQSCEKEEMPQVENLDVNVADAFATVQTPDPYPWDFYFIDYTVTVNEYDITFERKELSQVKGKPYTTFYYTVAGNGATAQLDSFYFSLPDCGGIITPSSWTPTQSSKLEENRLKWNSSISKDGKQSFSVTYPGDLDYGVVKAIVVRGGVEYSDYVVGPCANVYDLSGYVFIDADGDGNKDALESGLPNFSVVLEQGVNSAEVLTDQSGFYSFRVFPGMYDVSINNVLLNEGYYTPTFDGKATLSVPNELTADFGYRVKTTEMTDDFIDGDIPLTTVPAKDWGLAMKMAGKKNSPFTRTEAINLLKEVEGLFLKIPFDFGNDKISSAVEILTKPIQTEEDLFMQQLLAAELNFVTRRGATDANGDFDEEFNYALINYAEAKAAGEPAVAQELSIMATATRTYSLSDTRLLSSYNDNGSGGL